MKAYIDLWPLFSMALCAIGMYLMSIHHTVKGMWQRTSTGRVVRKMWRIIRGKPVTVVAIGGSGRRGLMSKRVSIDYHR